MGSQLTTLTAFWPCSFPNLPKGELRDVSQASGKVAWIPVWALSDQLGGLGESLNLSGLHFGLSPPVNRAGLSEGINEVARENTFQNCTL